MDFFEHQAKAHQFSRWLIVLFILAVAATIGIADLLISITFSYYTKSYMSMQTHFIVMITTFFVIMIASVYRLNSLDNGGRQVAEELGFWLVPSATRDPRERQLINVVEEIAIASGYPVPPTYIMHTDNLNAFAAGYTEHDAVIGVTSGLLEMLNREELQGVIGHEFSHIINGDIRINLNMTGILFGILFISLTGQKLLNIGGKLTTKDSDGNHIAGIFAIAGIFLVMVGHVGLTFGEIIKASLSRQREFLADASAVQLTRNPTGISNALKTIGGSQRETVIRGVQASEFSHFFFLDGIKHILPWSDTHPELEERIQRIEPNWDGRYIRKKRAKQPPKSQPKPSRKQTQPITSATVSASVVLETIMMAGMPSNNHMQYARQLIKAIPKPLHTASQSPLSANALVLGLMMHQSLLKDTAAQSRLLPNLGQLIMQELRQLLNALLTLKIQYRLPLISMSLPALKGLSPKQKTALNTDLLTIIHADDTVEVWEWALHYWITQLALRKPEIPKPKYDDFSQIADETTLLVSAVAYASSKAISETAQRLVFKAAERELGITLGIVNKAALTSDKLVKAVEDLRYLNPLLKANFLKALSLVAQHDGVIEAKEIELIRTIAEGIGCPIPPVIPA